MRVRTQGHLLQVKVDGEPPKHGVHQRGKITSFTRKSRKRLIDIIARFTNIQSAVFITLTYGQNWPEIQESKRHLKNFLQRIRDQYPMASGIWRLEFQERGAPHYHLLLFNLPFWKKEDLAAAWAATIGDEFCDWSSGRCLPPFTRIEMIRGLKHALAYVSKYIAKHESAHDAAEGGFNYAPYSQKSYSGRWWGILNLEGMPFAPALEIAFRCAGIADTIRFFAYFEQADPRRGKPQRSYIKKPFTKAFGDTSFSIFTDRINEWNALIRSVMLENTPQELSWMVR